MPRPFVVSSGDLLREEVACLRLLITVREQERDAAEAQRDVAIEEAHGFIDQLCESECEVRCLRRSKDRAEDEARTQRLVNNELRSLFEAAKRVGIDQEKELGDLYTQIANQRLYEFNATSDEIELRARIEELEAENATLMSQRPTGRFCFGDDDAETLARTAARIRQNLDARTNF